MAHLLAFSGMHRRRAATSGPQPSYSFSSSARDTSSTQRAPSGSACDPMGTSYRVAKAATLIWDDTKTTQSTNEPEDRLNDVAWCTYQFPVLYRNDDDMLYALQFFSTALGDTL